MAFVDNLPTELQSTIQQGWLDPAFEHGLNPIFGFRQLTKKEQYNGEVGQTVTRTKFNRLPLVTNPLPVRSNSDLDDGLTDVLLPLEQYILGVDQYASTMTLSIASATFSKANVMMENAYALGVNAGESMDALARQAMFDFYQGGNTYVRTTAGSGGSTSVAVDDVRGFFQLIKPASGQLLPTSSTNPMSVTINGATYSCTAAVADGTAPANISFNLKNLNFSGSSSNASTTPGGYSGTLTLTATVSQANATQGNTVKSVVGSNIYRPYDPSTGVMRSNATKIVAGDVLTLKMLRNAVAKMRANAFRDQLYFYASPTMLAPLFNDLEFRQYVQTNVNSEEFRSGVVTTAMGVTIVPTNLAYTDTTTVAGVNVHRGIIATQGILTEAEYTSSVYRDSIQSDNHVIRVVDNAALIMRAPLNRLADVIAQSWTAYTGFTCTSDYFTNPLNTPTADYTMYKRGCIVEAAEA